MSADKGYALTWSEIARRYPESQFIHVLPASDMLFATPRPDYRLDVAIVKIPPTKEFVFPIEKRYEGEGQDKREVWVTVSLLKAALERIIAAAEISAVPRRTDDRSDPLFASFEAFAVLTGPTGAVRTRVASKAWRGELAREKRIAEAEDKLAFFKARDWKLPLIGKKASAATEAELKAQFDSWFRAAWIREREFGPETAESKAVGRAVRGLLGIPATFSPRDLEAKSFLVPRWVFDPDVSDPEIRRLVITAGLNARLGVFAMNALQAAPEVKMLGPAPATTAPTRVVDAGPEEPEDIEPEPESQPAAPAAEKKPTREEVLLGQIEDLTLDDLTVEIARGMVHYAGKGKNTLRTRWETALAKEDVADMRQILRFILTGKATS